MRVISTQSGRSIYTSGDFIIQPLVSFSRYSTLSQYLPSSEEGRSAFKVVEGVIVTVQVQFTGLVMGEKVSEVIAFWCGGGVVSDAVNDIESSHVYSRMSDKNKTKIQLRLRKLVEACSKKEAIESNADLLANNVTMEATQAEINELIFKINRLLNVCSNEVIVQPKDLDLGVEEFIMDHVSDLDMDKEKLMTLLLARVATYKIT